MATGRIRRLAIFALLLPLGISGCKSTPTSHEPVAAEDLTGYTADSDQLKPEDDKSPNVETPRIVQACYEQPEEVPFDFRATATVEPLPQPLSSDMHRGLQRYPIDLATTFQLAGANNLQIAFARQRVAEAAARVDAADVLWVPSLQGGIVYNNHSGRLQATQGNIVEASRSSLFVGAGAMSADSPLTAGSSGPARMFVDLPLVDVLFEPLATRQSVDARQADQAATFNDTLLAAGRAYLQLLLAESQLAVTAEAVENAQKLARLTADFAQAGQGLQADAQRAQVELADRRRQLSEAQESVGVASAELARILRLNQSVVLFPAEGQPLPLDLISSEVPLEALVQQALISRPELGRQSALVDQTFTRVRQETLRPLLPNVFAGFSGGGFGGSPGSSIDGFSGRGDFDVGAIWEFENLGMGNLARQRQANSVHQQAHIARAQIRDTIAAEVARAYRQVQARREQVDSARMQVQSALRALTLNFDGIRGAVVRPIEAQQAIAALASARSDYVAAIVGYNEAQLSLIRALGQPPTFDVAVVE